MQHTESSVVDVVCRTTELSLLCLVRENPTTRSALSPSRVNF